MNNNKISGFIICFTAFMSWGLLPFFWDKMFYMPGKAVISYRILASWIFIALLITIMKQWKETLSIFKDTKSLILLFICGLTIAINWSLYIIALEHGKYLETSMGYYIAPLINALFGYLVFREKTNRLQIIAITIVFMGVMYMLLAYGQLPGFALLLALSFAVYGALHKFVKFNVIQGMFFEMLILVVPVLLILYQTGPVHGEVGLVTHIILIAFSGVFTALPLVGFAYGVKYLNLTTVGIIQYVSPTSTFILGIFYFKEKFTDYFLTAFIFIWIGVLLYIINLLIELNKKRTRTAKLKS